MNMTLISLVLVALLGGPLSVEEHSPAPAGEKITVYKSRTCGCCGKWVEHLQKAGFDVTVHEVDSVDNAPGRDRVPAELRSCHIASVKRYAIEGHVPADVIKDFLAKNPELEGLAVPGMPAGSPGMESPTPQPYEIIAWERTGKKTVFAKR
jgi:hypothetical protein